METALLVINGALLFFLWKSNAHGRKLADRISEIAAGSEKIRSSTIDLAEGYAAITKRTEMHLTALGIEIREVKQKLEEIEEEM